MKIAGEEADLSWPVLRLIVEIDGGPFHLDVGEDARKQAVWEAAGWTLKRIDADDVYERPRHLLAVAPNVPRPPPIGGSAGRFGLSRGSGSLSAGGGRGRTPSSRCG